MLPDVSDACGEFPSSGTQYPLFRHPDNPRAFVPGYSVALLEWGTIWHKSNICPRIDGHKAEVQVQP